MTPSGMRTTRISSFFGLSCPQPTHIRCGTFLSLGCCPLAITVTPFRRTPVISGETPYASSVSAYSAASVSQAPAFAWLSDLMSIFQPVSRAARRAFCPSLPIASESW